MKMYAALRNSRCCVHFDADFEKTKEKAIASANYVYDTEIRVYEVDDFVPFYDLWNFDEYQPPVYVAKPRRHIEVYRSDLERIYKRYIKQHTGCEDERLEFWEWFDDVEQENIFRTVVEDEK